MASKNMYRIKKNLHEIDAVSCNGNLAALLLSIFGTSEVRNLERCHISVAEDGRMLAKYKSDIYTVEQLA